MTEPTDLNDLAALARVTKSTRYRRALASAADEIERLRKERDEARREVCAFVSGRYSKDVVTLDRSAALEEAKQRGWDCFKENTHE